MFARKPLLLTLVALALLLLAACGRHPAGSAKQGKPAVEPTPVVQSAQAPAVQPAATTEASSANLPPSADVKAVQTAVQKAVQEQVQAFSSSDPAVMQDTATSTYYDQSVQNLVDMANSGVTAMQLDSLNWGPVTFPSATTAQATTTETWSTTMANGQVVKQTNTSVYTLVLDNGTWKVQDAQHPNTAGQLQTSNTGEATTPASLPLATGQSRSRNWSGYSTTAGTFTAVSGTWTVPSVAARPAGMDATWVGIGGVSGNDLIQAGTQAVARGGRVKYSAWFEMLPQPAEQISLAVNAGDKITVAINQLADGTWKIGINNLTSGQSWAQSFIYNSSRSSAEWVQEAPAAARHLVLPLDMFGSVTFSAGTAVMNGRTLTIAQAGGQPINMLNYQKMVIAQTSVLGGDGESFTVFRTK